MIVRTAPTVTNALRKKRRPMVFGGRFLGGTGSGFAGLAGGADGRFCADCGTVGLDFAGCEGVAGACFPLSSTEDFCWEDAFSLLPSAK